MDCHILCIFTHTGRTYTFKNVKIVYNTESILQFNYRAMSDGFMRDYSDTLKVATFLKRNIYGWSVTPKSDFENMREKIEET